MSSQSFSLKEVLSVFLFFLILYFAFLYATGTLTSGFHFMDDESFIIFNDILESGQKSFWELVHYTMGLQYDTARFRPAYWFFIVLQTHLMEVNYFNYAVMMGVMGALTATLLFVFGRKLGFTWYEAILFVLLTLVGPQAEIWWMNGPCESRAMLFLSASLIFASLAAQDGKNRIVYEVVFCILLSIAAYCKESFALAIPAILLFKAYLQKRITGDDWKTIIRKNILQALFLGAVLLSVVYFARLKNPALSLDYAGVSNSTGAEEYLTVFFDFILLKNLFWVCLVQLFFVVGALFYYIDNTAVFKRELSQLFRLYIPILLIAGVFILPQVVLYTKSTFVGRYYVPVMLPVAFLLTMPLAYIRRHFPLVTSRPLKISVSLIVLFLSTLFLSAQYREAHQAGSNFASFGGEINSLLGSVLQNTPDKGSVVVIYDPAADAETIISFRSYVQTLNRRDNPIIDMSVEKVPSASQELATPDTIVSLVLLSAANEEGFLNKANGWFDPRLFTRKMHGRYVHYYKSS